jgi:opacity protein-like surface antigen
MATTLVRGVAMGMALVLSAQLAQAQTGVSLGFGGGAAMPTGAYGDAFGTGWSSQLVARVKPGASPVGLQVDGFYNRFGLEGGIDGNSRLLGGTANAVFAFPTGSRARPYLIGGLGVYNGKTTIDGLGSTDSETKWAPMPARDSTSASASTLRCSRKAASTRSSRARPMWPRSRNRRRTWCR